MAFYDLPHTGFQRIGGKAMLRIRCVKDKPTSESLDDVFEV
jgi:hypothetical protein